MTDRQSERSTSSLKPGDGVPGAMMVRGLKDTSSRPAKDLGGTLRRTFQTALRSYDSRASGDRQYPLSSGARGKYGENQIRHQQSEQPRRDTAALCHVASILSGAALFCQFLHQANTLHQIIYLLEKLT